MANGDKNTRTQSTLNEFIATKKANPEMTDEQWFKTFPEFNGDVKILDAAFVYAGTAASGKYNLEELNAKFTDKFPEFFDSKKKELGGKGLQKDWESLQKYEVEHPKFEEFDPDEVMAQAESQAQAARQEQFRAQLPAEVQEAEAGLPTEQEQLEVIKEVNPQEAAKIEAEQAEVEKIEAAKQQDDAELVAQANVFKFNKSYGAMLEEGDAMNFESVEDYANHFKDAAAKQFLLSDGDQTEYKIRSEIERLEKLKRDGGPITDEQIEAMRNQADAARAEKYKDIDDDISDLRDQLATEELSTPERNAIKEDIQFREDLKKDVFETDPAKLASRAKETIDESEGAKNLLARVTETMPEGLSGKEKFDRYYNVLYKQYRDLSQKLGFEVSKKGEIIDPIMGEATKRSTVTPFMALKAVTGTLSSDEEELLGTLKILERLSPTYLLNQTSLKGRSGFFSTFWDNFGERLAGPASAKEREQVTARKLQETFDIIGVPKEQLTEGVTGVLEEVGKDYTYDDWEGSKQKIAMLTSTIVDIGLKYAIGGGVTTRALKLLGKTKIGKDIAILSKTGKLEGTTNRYYKALSKVPGITKFTAKGLGEGLRFEGAGQIFRRDQDELNFLSGFLGSSVGTLVKGAATPLVNKVFGMFGAATPQVVAKITEIGSRGVGELSEETTQELFQIYKATDNYKEFKAELSRRFGKTSDKLEFIISSMLMGSVFGSVNTEHVKDFYNNEATAEERALIDEVSRDIPNDVSTSIKTAIEDVPEAQRIEDIESRLSQDMKSLRETDEGDLTPEERQALEDELREIKDISEDKPAYTEEPVTEEVVTEEVTGEPVVEEEVEAEPVTEAEKVEVPKISPRKEGTPADIDEAHVPLEQRPPEIQEVFNEMFSAIEKDPSNISLLRGIDPDSTNWLKLSEIRNAVKDIQQGKNTVRASMLMNTIHDAANKGMVPISEGKQRAEIPFDEFVENIKQQSDISNINTEDLSPEMVEMIESESDFLFGGVIDNLIKMVGEGVPFGKKGGKIRIAGNRVLTPKQQKKFLNILNEIKDGTIEVSTDKNEFISIERIDESGSRSVIYGKETGREAEPGVEIEAEVEPGVEAEMEVEEAFPFDKPIQDIDISEKSNYDKVLSFFESGKEKLKKQRKETLGMGLPVAVAELGLDAMILAMKAGKQMAEVMEIGRQAVINSEWYKSLNKKDQKAAIDQFIKETNRGFGIKKVRKTPVQKKIEETTEGKITGKITIGEKQLVKRLIKSVGKGMKAGTKLTKKDIKKSILEGLEPLKGTLTKTQTSSIVNRATATNFDNPKMVAKLEEHVNKVIFRANYVEDLKTAKNISKKLKKVVRSKKLGIEMENIVKHIANIPVQKLDSIEIYNRIAEDVYKAVTGMGTGFPKDIKKLFGAADSEIRAYDKGVENRRLEIEYEQSGLEEAGIDFDEFKFMDRLTKESEPEAVIEEVEKKKSEKSKFLIAVLPFRLKELRDLAKDETVDLTEKQKRTLNTIGNVDIDKLSIGQLVELNNIITSILEFDSYNRVAQLEAFIEADKRAPKFKKYDEKLRASTWFHKYMTVTTFMKSLVVGGRSARSFIKDLIGKLDIAKNKAVTKSNKFDSKVDKAFRGLSSDQNRKIGMISFVVQTQGGTIEEINAEFEERKEGVLGTVDALREKGKKSKKLFAFQAKRNRNKADKIEEAYNEYLADTKTPEEAIAKLNEKEKQVYDMLKEEFAKIKDALADSQARYNGKEFVEYTNYLPTEARKIDKFTKEEFSIEDPKSPPGTNFVDTQQAGTTIERQAVDGTGKTIYNFDLMDMVKRKYYESVYDIETLHERNVINKLINNSTFKNIMETDIHRVLVEKLNSMISTQKNQDYNAAIELPIILKQLAAVVRFGKRVKLATIDQVLKQPIPVLVHTAIYNIESPLSVFKAIGQVYKVVFDSEYRAAFNELFAGSDSINRVLLGDTVQDREMRSEFDKLSNNDFMRNFNRVRQAIANATSATLIHSDNIATKISLVSSYIYELDKQGVDTKDFDLVKAAKNKNQEALSQADGRTDDINNISDFSKTADLFKSKSTNDKIIRELFWNYKSFSLNAGMNAFVEIRNLASKDATRDEKFDSFKYLVGWLAQQATFNALKIYVVNVLWDRLAEALFDGEDKEETIEEELRKLGSNTGMEMIGSVMPSLGEDMAKLAINEAYLNYKKSEWEERYGRGKRIRGKRPPKPTKYTDNIFYVNDSKMLGSYAIPYETSKDMVQIIKAVASGKEFSKSDYLKLGSTTAFVTGIGDLDRLFSKAYWRVKREEKKRESKRGRR